MRNRKLCKLPHVKRGLCCKESCFAILGEERELDMAPPRLALLIGELLEIKVTSRNQGNYCSPIQPSSTHGLISLISSTFLCAEIQSFPWELASSAFLLLVTGPPKYLLQHLSLHDFLAHTSASPRIRILVVLMLVFPLFSPNNL